MKRPNRNWAATINQRNLRLYLVAYRRRIVLGLSALLVYQVLGLILADRTSQGPYIYATRNIPAGEQIAAADIASANWFGVARWATLLDSEAEVVGHFSTTDLVAGEPISSANLLANATTLAGDQQRILVQVASATLDFIEVGNHIDIYLPQSLDIAGRRVASDVVVVAEIATTDKFVSAQSAALVVTAPQNQIQELATIDQSAQVNIVLRAG